MNKILISALFAVFSVTSPLSAKTFEEVLSIFQIGMEKAQALEKEETATLIPAGSFGNPHNRDSIVIRYAEGESLTICQFHLIDDKIAAMMIGRVPVTENPSDLIDEFHFLPEGKNHPFEVLRTDSEMNPIEVTVNKRKFDEPSIYFFTAVTETSSELWIIDEDRTESKSFFLKPTDAMKQKLKDQKKVIQQRLEASGLNSDKSSANKTEQATP